MILGVEDWQEEAHIQWGCPRQGDLPSWGCHSPRLKVSQNQRTLVFKEPQCHLALSDLNSLIQTICGVGKVPRQLRVTVAFGEDSSIVLSTPVMRLTTIRFQPQKIQCFLLWQAPAHKHSYPPFHNQNKQNQILKNSLYGC